MELTNNVDAVWLAKSCMVKRMDAFVARMQHLRNLASPIHRLPLDILSIILDGFPVWSSSPGQTSLVDLIKVDRVWYHAIVNLPHFWKIVPLDTPPKLARLVLERSQLPLTITSLSMVAMTSSEDQAVGEDPSAPEGMVTMTIPAGLPEIAVGASERWKEMDFTLSCEGYEKVEQLLEASTPALEVLRVLVKYPSLSRTMGPFTLSKGPPLKELVLYCVCTSWSSPRFTNLARLDLGGANSGPSINQLLRILSNSPRLEHLSLVSLQPPNYGASSLSGTTEPIVLEHLQTLNCNMVHLWDGLPALPTSYWDEMIWNPGNTLTAGVLGLNASMTERRRLDILLETDGINFKNQDNQLQEHLDLIICRRDFRDLLPRIQLLLATWDPLPEIKLKVEKDAPFGSLVHWSPLLRSLHVKGSMHCQRALRELATQTTTLILESTSWTCPALLDVALEYDKFDREDVSLDVVALRSLLDQRWSKSGPESVIAPQTPSFTVICSSAGFPQMWASSEQFTRIMPSFRMAAAY
ncbi:hypothetical protein FRC04_001065 [Tulasnella sp. 424]|nr:hypothetical protein FRC04_001065 [Tulasnella sp. 424]